VAGIELDLLHGKNDGGLGGHCSHHLVYNHH
jgi:hypothetical protein